MGHVDHAVPLLSNPVFLGERLALRAVPVAAGVVGGVLEAATVTVVEVSA
jgi:hypothetical protein